MIDNPLIKMRALSRGQLREEILSFNNTAYQRIEGMWMYFRASDFAARGISQQLGRRVQRIVRDEYRILMSNNPKNHI